MSLTVHFINKNWERVQVVLNVKAMFGSHTGDYIGETFVNLLDEWDIAHDRVHMVLRDSGANMIKGLRVAEVPGLSCSAHTLQLVINDGLTAQRAVSDMIAKFKRIATHFNHSVVAQQRLAVIQTEMGVPHHSIVQSVPTRWNSTLHMIARMLEQKRAITAYSSDYGHFVSPTPNEWDLAGKLVETLMPLEEITLEMSKSDSSVSCIIPSVGVLKTLLQSEGPNTVGIQTVRKTMLESLDKRFSKINEAKEVVLACLLDPRYKHRPLSQDALFRAKSWLDEETQNDERAVETEEAPAEEADPKRLRVESHSVLDNLFDTMLASTSQEDQPLKTSRRNFRADNYYHYYYYYYHHHHHYYYYYYKVYYYFYYNYYYF
ncbi:hypothetical protein WMY93_013723 [Mugilogobius chulae]|uniref:Zinc finger BED domain-containing protein 4 n=1 Tax=Mugilogobius chulae TaxID=88201 RepID=A0AAW0P4V9_9GOBI